jgi:hypothetical protein
MKYIEEIRINTCRIPLATRPPLRLSNELSKIELIVICIFNQRLFNFSSLVVPRNELINDDERF